MFSYTGLAEVDMTKVAVALYYSDLTKVTPGHVLGIVMGIHLCLLNLKNIDAMVNLFVNLYSCSLNKITKKMWGFFN